MKVIVAGSRTITDKGFIAECMFEWFYASGGDIEFVTGGARGVDTIAEQQAVNAGVKCTVFPAEWGKYGKRAGYLRNAAMADYADGLLAIWDGKSKGTKHMIDLAEKEGLEVEVVTYDGK